MSVVYHLSGYSKTIVIEKNVELGFPPYMQIAILVMVTNIDFRKRHMIFASFYFLFETEAPLNIYIASNNSLSDTGFLTALEYPSWKVTHTLSLSPPSSIFAFFFL